MSHDFPQSLPIFKYKTHFWGEDLENYRKYQEIKVALPPPSPGPYSKAEFLQDGGLTIAINNQQDGEKFSTMRDGEKYLVSFSSQMSLTEYFKIKMKLYQIAKEKKLEFRTEIELGE